jgi:hypothetical protein
VDSVLKPSLLKPGSGNLRAYLAGTGATGALIGGAAVVFLSALAFVAFNGFSFPSSGDESSISLSSQQPARIGQAPIAAANAVGPGAGAVAATPTAVGGPSSSGPGATAPGSGPGSTGETPNGGSSSGGPISGVVGDVDSATPRGLPNVGDATDPVTGPVDDAVGNTLNQAGGAVGNPHLGDQVNDTVKGITDGVVGNNGLLGGN